ncbi:unnamed protein product [Urochloa humidicola]
MTSSSLACFATYRPPVALDIFSCPAVAAASEDDELLLSDGEWYNHNCRHIPEPALQELVRFLRKHPTLAAKCEATTEDVESGRVTGVVFVSEREDGLETLHVALRYGADRGSKVTVLPLAEIYGADTFGGGTRMEDSPCVAVGFTAEDGRKVGPSLVYVSTKEPATRRRTPWTVVYRTRLADGKTERLTPPGQYDLSPAVSPLGKMVAVANFQWNEWTGEIDKLNTHIAVMNVDRQARGGQLERRIIIKDGGWPTWGSDQVIFFHRQIKRTDANGDTVKSWGVFRYDMATGDPPTRVTPDKGDFVTPAAIDEHRVAVAATRKKPISDDVHQFTPTKLQCRQIEIFDSRKQSPKNYERVTRGYTDHFNPSVLGGGRIGYHRCRGDGTPPEGRLDRLQTPASHADVALLRMSHAFPAVSKDGSKLAFVDNKFTKLYVWIRGSKAPKLVYQLSGSNRFFYPVWHPKEDTLCVCMGPSFTREQALDIVAFREVSTRDTPNMVELTKNDRRGLNNAFPSFNKDGTKLVFRSTRDRTTGRKETDRVYKNLYIMHNTIEGEDGGPVTQLTDGEWTDTHCSWAPEGDLIVFSSTRDKPTTEGIPALDNDLDPGYFAVYLVSAVDKTWIRVIRSGLDLAGHINHPVFSPDCRSIAFAADLAAVSADPMSLPVFLHSVRPYGDIFAVDINPEAMSKNKDVDEFHRLTHSRYEYSMPAWTTASLEDLNKAMTMVADGSAPPACPYARPSAGNWGMTGHLFLSNKRCC